MAAITRVKARPVSPPGFEYQNIAAQAKVALVAGDLVQIASDTPGLGYPFVVEKLTTANAKTGVKKYVAITDAKASSVANIGDELEMDGWSGMTPGNPVYPSGSTAGGLDTTAPTNSITETVDADAGVVAVPVEARMHAITATRIRFRL